MKDRARSFRHSRSSDSSLKKEGGDNKEGGKPRPALRRVKTSEAVRIKRTGSGVAQAVAEAGDVDFDLDINDLKMESEGKKKVGRSKSPLRTRSGRIVKSGSDQGPSTSSRRLMSASTPGHSEKEIGIDEAREKAAQVLERIEGSQADLFKDEDMDEDSMRGDIVGDMNQSFAITGSRFGRKKAMMSASTPGASTRKASFHNSFHSSVAQRFLEHPDDSEGSDEFDLRLNTLTGGKYNEKPKKSKGTSSGIGSLAGLQDSWMGKLSESLHSLRTYSKNDTGDEDSDDESAFDAGESYSSSNDEITFEGNNKNVFNNKLRKDLREVDQSVNLMNAETAKYEYSDRGKKSKKHKKRKSMIKWFLSGTKKFPRGKYSYRPTGAALGTGCCVVFLIVIIASVLMLMPHWDTIFPESPDTSTTDQSEKPAVTLAPTESTVTDEESPARPREPSRPSPTVSSSLKSPFFSREEVAVRERLLEKILNDQDSILNTNTVAARKANAWIVAYDPAQLNLESFHDDPYSIVQRYVLATLFFVTNPDVQASTAPHLPEEEEERDNRDNLNRRQLQDTLTFVDWMTATHVCWWEGMNCNNNGERLITKMDLSESHLHGTLPPELGMLTSLTDVDFSHNRLEADVPEGWANSLVALESLELHDNSFTGTVPDKFCDLKSLEFFTTDCDTTDLECECCTECL